ncbi:hypothetical protein DM02DRAFT_665451 [Periconia macrospinosa]|uniref:Chromo domain-containing protein n=1 Tax=Periconia macrospinosa TaxID=97972 RepID=A0A2V1CWQ3_9PLEO|nr:hypothetical protein DM02DRAFT_665451 [Periconia macrospinosa]
MTPTSRQASSDSSEPDDAEDDSSDHTIAPALKRKRFLLPKQHSQTSSTILNQRPKHAKHPARQHKPSSVRGKLGRPSLLKPFSAAQHSGCNTDTRLSYDRSNKNTRHAATSKRSMSTSRPVRSHRHKRERNCSIANQDVEYEVDKILEARIYYRKLQYRVKWVGYADDLDWYNAANFKNSP